MNRPFIVLFEQKGADEATYGFLVGEDADDVGASLDLAVEAFDRVRAVELGSMFLGEAHIGQDVRFGLVHDGGEFGHLGADLIGNGAPLGAGGFRRFLGEGGANEGRDDASPTFTGMGKRVAHEVNATALPGGTKDLADRSLYAFVGVGDNEFDAAQA